MVKEIWSLKYRPSTIDGYIFQNKQHESFIKQCIADKSIANVMFSGYPGTGKTTLALMLKHELGIEDSDYLFLNASSSNNVDTVRNTIDSFIRTMAMGEFKLVLLDEFDRFTGAAQDALRSMIEDPEVTANARFIATANNPQKLTGPMRSRFQEFTFKTIDKDMMLEKAAEILMAEKVKIPNLELLDKYVDMAFPDLRKLIGLLQQHSIGNVLQEPTSTTNVSMDYKLEMLECLERDDWEKIRDVVCNNVDGEEWVKVYEFIYDYIHEVGKFKDVKKWKQAIIIIADHLYKHDKVQNVAINFVACIIRLTEV